SIVFVGAPLVEFETGAQEEADQDAGAIVGRLARGADTAVTPSTGGQRMTRARTSTRVRAAPAVRALARRLGVSLEGLTGSGPSGTLTSSDVERAAAARGGEETESAGAAADARAPGAVGEPLRGARRAMARTMARAQAEVAGATVIDEADVGNWAVDAEADVTGRLVRALVAACHAEPALNAWYDAATDRLRRHARVDLGLAVDTAEGL